MVVPSAIWYSANAGAAGETGTSMETRISPSAATMRAPDMAGWSIVKVTGSVVDSPGARLFSRAEGVLNLTPGVGLSHLSSVVAERVAPLFQNLRRSRTGCPAVAHDAPAIS